MINKHFAYPILMFLLLVSTNVSAQFKKGYYYTLNGEKVEGYIKHKIGDKEWMLEANNYIEYKPDKKQKSKALTSKEIKSFIIERDSTMQRDSFVLLNNLEGKDFSNYSKDFAKVEIEGKISLYTHYSLKSSRGSLTNTGSGFVTMGGGYSKVATPLVRKDKKAYSIHNKAKFREVMINMLSDYPELQEMVTNKDFELKNLEALIEIYNSKYED